MDTAESRAAPALPVPAVRPGSHKGSEIGIDDFQTDRSPDRSYRTAPLRGLMTHAKGGFYHDGRFADLNAASSTTTSF